MGGAVNGGSFTATTPRFARTAPGRRARHYAPTTSVDEYFTELVRWFGVPASADRRAANVGRFYSPQSSDLPLGFLRL